jgi:hypothetical protein
MHKSDLSSEFHAWKNTYLKEGGKVYTAKSDLFRRLSLGA